MSIPQYTAIRFEGIMSEGRTHPVVLGCREDAVDIVSAPKLVKAIGCPEVTARYQLVAEVLGNAIARRMGVQTPEPCVVAIDAPVCQAINASLRSLGYPHSIQPGYAAGSKWLPGFAPYTVGQPLSNDLQLQAVRLYVFDMMSQNPDRRPDKVNCGLMGDGLIAVDFEMCFQHLFLPIIGGNTGKLWEPSKSLSGRRHLFFSIVQKCSATVDAVEQMVSGLTRSWWDGIMEGLPEAWRPEAERVAEVVLAVSENAAAFGVDILRSLA